MKAAEDAPSRQELIEWCRERAAANRTFDGKLTQGMLVLIRQEWPVYFDTIAYLLQRDGSNASGSQS